VLELLVKVALPEVRRLQDVHVAIEDFETVFCHDSPREVQPVKVVQAVQAGDGKNPGMTAPSL
jgi:hypothetical protein